jgi:hypothetical protein
VRVDHHDLTGVAERFAALGQPRADGGAGAPVDLPEQALTGLPQMMDTRSSGFGR